MSNEERPRFNNKKGKNSSITRTLKDLYVNDKDIVQGVSEKT